MLEHILRRLGFGISPSELAAFAGMSASAVIDRLLNYETAIDNSQLDRAIGSADFVGVTTSSGQPFSPNTLINDARQRWLFRMVHSQRPLEEKMALFWHNHFATGYTKVAGVVGTIHATKMMDADPFIFGQQFKGQIHLFREMATASFRDLLIAVAKDPAMLVWLDGRTNTKAKPQENFGREIMELFTIGLGNYTEQDVYAAARVFTGWNMTLIGNRDDQVASYYQYQFQSGNHDTAAKEFTFPIYPDGGRVIPARAASPGEQDGIDLITALATKLYKFVVNETTEPDPSMISAMAQSYLSSNYSIKSMLRTLVSSSAFTSSANYFQRYSWPVEYVVRAIKETGFSGFSVNSAITPLLNMGQQLYEPPDVNGWELGPGWFSTASMLSRMNFSSTLAQNQKFNLARDAQPYKASPDRVLEYMLSRFQTIGFDSTGTTALQQYLRSGSGWTGTDAQLQTRVPGLTRLIVGSGEYQFN
jgi:uncharacterized protein (DUF1800 family)